MPRRKITTKVETSRQHPEQVDLPARAVASFISSSGHDYESVWDVSNRICDRYLLQKSSPASVTASHHK